MYGSGNCTVGGGEGAEWFIDMDYCWLKTHGHAHLLLSQNTAVCVYSIGNCAPVS